MCGEARGTFESFEAHQVSCFSNANPAFSNAARPPYNRTTKIPSNANTPISNASTPSFEHQVSCASGSHLVGGFEVTTDGCEAGPDARASRRRALQARVQFACVGNQHATAGRSGAWGGASAVERLGMVEVGDVARR